MSSTTTRGPHGTTLLAGLRIVVVDDVDDARAMAAEILRCCGAEVAEASSSADALKLIRWTWPHVLVSDISMPEEDGCALIRKVRALPGALGRTPAIALSAFDDLRDRRAALYAGFDLHMPKANGVDALLGAVHQMSCRHGWTSSTLRPMGVELPEPTEGATPATSRACELHQTGGQRVPAAHEPGPLVVETPDRPMVDSDDR